MSSVEAGRRLLDADFAAVPSSVPAARRSVRALAGGCGAHGEDLERIALAVSEAVTNAIVHGYRGAGSGSVRVTAAEAAGVLTVLVADDGCGLGRAPAGEGLGLGLGLIRRSCDWLTISERGSGGTLLEMSFELRREGWGRERALALQERASRSPASSPA